MNEEKNEPKMVFWYYAGNVSRSVKVGGEPVLASPYKYLLAPSGQKWPKPIVHLFKRKTPPKDVVKAFGESAKLTAEYKKIVEEETAKAERDAKTAKKEKAAAARKGNAQAKKAMAEAVEEKGRQNPPNEQLSPESQPEDKPSSGRGGRGRRRE